MIDLASILEAIRRVNPDMLQRFFGGGGGTPWGQMGMGGGGEAPPGMSAPPFNAQPAGPNPMPSDGLTMAPPGGWEGNRADSGPTLGRGRQPLGGGMLEPRPMPLPQMTPGGPYNTRSDPNRNRVPPGTRPGINPMPWPEMVAGGGGPSVSMSPAPGQTPWQNAGFDSRRQAVQAARKAGWQGDAIGGLNQGLRFLQDQGGAGGGNTLQTKPASTIRRQAPRGRR